SGFAFSFSAASARDKSCGCQKAPAVASARARVGKFVFGLSVAKTRVEFGHCFVRVGKILFHQIIRKSADFSAAHFERFGVTNVCRLENLGSERAGGLHLFHVPEPRELQRMRERIGLRLFAEES